MTGSTRSYSVQRVRKGNTFEWIGGRFYLAKTIAAGFVPGDALLLCFTKPPVCQQSSTRLSATLWLAIGSEIKLSLCSTLLIHYFCFHAFHFLSGCCHVSSLTSFHVHAFSLFPSVPFPLGLWSRPDQSLDWLYHSYVDQRVSLIPHWHLPLAMALPVYQKPPLQWEFWLRA